MWFSIVMMKIPDIYSRTWMEFFQLLNHLSYYISARYQEAENKLARCKSYPVDLCTLLRQCKVWIISQYVQIILSVGQISFLSVICFRLSLWMTFNFHVTRSFKHRCFYIDIVIFNNDKVNYIRDMWFAMSCYCKSVYCNSWCVSVS